MIRWLRNRIRLCQHVSSYRERRTVGDVDGVMCFVCHDCGASWPCVDRSPEQHREMQEAGKVIRSVAKRQPAKVEDFRRHGR